MGSSNLYKQQQQQQQQQQNSNGSNGLASYFGNQSGYSQQQQNTSNQGGMATNNSLASLQPLNGQSSNSFSRQLMNKTDSHAVLMELFARDQDLVRQATEGAKLKASAAIDNKNLSNGNNLSHQQHQVTSQHPMKMGNISAKMGSVPALNSWPHFSSVSSLNNLGTLTGVKSITNMSGADLASQGNLNKKGNLAQVKSIESMVSIFIVCSLALRKDFHIALFFHNCRVGRTLMLFLKYFSMIVVVKTETGLNDLEIKESAKKILILDSLSKMMGHHLAHQSHILPWYNLLLELLDLPHYLQTTRTNQVLPEVTMIAIH